MVREPDGPQLNALDKAIAWAFPGWAERRMVARHALHQILNDQDARSNFQRGYTPNVEQEVRRDRKHLLATARRLMKDNPYACGAVASQVANVIGAGFGMELRVRNRQGGLVQQANEAGERVFDNWAKGADLTGNRPFNTLQSEMYKEYSVAGECFAVRHTVEDGRAVPLGVELRPAESLSDLDTDSIQQGVEFNATGQPTAYHFYVSPESTDTERVPAADVVHFFEPHRIGAVRGLSPLGPVARSFDGLRRYLDHEIRRAEVSSSFVMLWKQGGKIPTLNSPSGRTEDGYQNMMQVLPEGGGVMVRGGKDDAIDSFAPSIENTAFQAFVEVVLRQAASGLGMSYELIARDFTKTNFSSARQASLEDRRHWTPRQDWFMTAFLEIVWSWFLSAARIAGVQPFAGQRFEWPAEWQPPGWHWVDPDKELKAINQAIGMGLDNPYDAAKRYGSDYEENIKKKAEAETAAETAGTQVDTGTQDVQDPNQAEEGTDAPEGADEGPSGPNLAAA